MDLSEKVGFDKNGIHHILDTLQFLRAEKAVFEVVMQALGKSLHNWCSAMATSRVRF